MSPKSILKVAKEAEYTGFLSIWVRAWYVNRCDIGQKNYTEKAIEA
jgi:hypothetical protein